MADLPPQPTADPPPGGGPPDPPPGVNPTPDGPDPRALRATRAPRGWPRTVGIVVLITVAVIVAVLLLGLGICVAILSSGSPGTSG